MEGEPASAKESLEQIMKLVKKRNENFDYLKRLHHGSVYWMNVVHITKEDITKFYEQEKKEGPAFLQKRAEDLFYIGISLAPLLSLHSGDTLIDALISFWEEYEPFAKKSATPKTPDFNAMFPKAGSNSFLNTPNVPCALSYFEVIVTLCDLLKHIYNKFMDTAEVTPQQFKNIAKVDQRFKTHLLGGLSKDMNTLAKQIISQQMSSLDGVFANTYSESGHSPGTL